MHDYSGWLLTGPTIVQIETKLLTTERLNVAQKSNCLLNSGLLATIGKEEGMWEEVTFNIHYSSFSTADYHTPFLRRSSKATFSSDNWNDFINFDQQFIGSREELVLHMILCSINSNKKEIEKYKTIKASNGAPRVLSDRFSKASIIHASLQLIEQNLKKLR